MYERKSAILMLGALIVIASVITCLFAFLMATHFDDTDKYDVSREYDVTGTVTEGSATYYCTGTGDSKYINETGTDRIYVFKFNTEYSESSMMNLKFDLFCDHYGVPLTSMYEKISENEDASVWRCTEEGLTFVFTIGEYCKVSDMEITGNGLSLKAILKE